MHRNDGCIVDAELLRPRWWIAQNKIIAGNSLPMNIEELQVQGSAKVTSIDDCPEIAGGEGSIVTATFNTREVNTIVHAEIIGPDGSIETISGTPIHPVWSIDRSDWVPLGELAEGETLQAADGIATVLSLALVTCSLPVYNIEVHGEHVYQVGELGLLVHNANECLIRFGQAAESAAQLADDAARAVANGFPHGVSTKLVQRVSGSDKLHKVASKADVEAAFFVEQTGSRLTHYTVHLPHPVTDDVAALFNSVFKPLK
jgi:hypothetical protein